MPSPNDQAVLNCILSPLLPSIEVGDDDGKKQPSGKSFFFFLNNEVSVVFSRFWCMNFDVFYQNIWSK